MTWSSLLDEFKKPHDPHFPGLGKDPKIGFAVGFLLGAIGVGLYLRSWRDALSCFAVCSAVAFMVHALATMLLCWLLCGSWVYFRIQRSERRFAALQRREQCAQGQHPVENTPVHHIDTPGPLIA